MNWHVYNHIQRQLDVFFANQALFLHSALWRCRLGSDNTYSGTKIARKRCQGDEPRLEVVTVVKIEFRHLPSFFSQPIALAQAVPGQNTH